MRTESELSENGFGNTGGGNQWLTSNTFDRMHKDKWSAIFDTNTWALSFKRPFLQAFILTKHCLSPQGYFSTMTYSCSKVFSPLHLGNVYSLSTTPYQLVTWANSTEVTTSFHTPSPTLSKQGIFSYLLFEMKNWDCWMYRPAAFFSLTAICAGHNQFSTGPKWWHFKCVTLFIHHYFSHSDVITKIMSYNLVQSYYSSFYCF